MTIEAIEKACQMDEVKKLPESGPAKDAPPVPDLYAAIVTG
jgi:hypothetical protein